MKDYKRMTVGEIVADNFNNAGIFDKRVSIIQSILKQPCL